MKTLLCPVLCTLVAASATAQLTPSRNRRRSTDTTRSAPTGRPASFAEEPPDLLTGDSCGVDGGLALARGNGGGK